MYAYFVLFSNFRQIEKIDFDKYWCYAFAILMYSGYASIWSMATIFDDGRFLADFMSRWNLCVVGMNYHPFDGIRSLMCWSIGWLLLYASIMIFFFNYDYETLPAVRGRSELLGLLLLRSYVTEVRITRYFYLVRAFGLFFHLYAVYAARSLTLWILIYCKFLENMARRWNLRFCYRFGMREWKI